MVPNGQAVNNAISWCHDVPRMHLRLLLSFVYVMGRIRFWG